MKTVQNAKVHEIFKANLIFLETGYNFVTRHFHFMKRFVSIKSKIIYIHTYRAIVEILTN